MKKVFLISLIVLLVSCDTQRQTPLSTQPTEASSGEIILLGKSNKANLQTSDITSWVEEQSHKLSADPQWGNDVQPHLKGLKIKVFMGTWCEDSQREIPHFFKLLEQRRYYQNNI